MGFSLEIDAPVNGRIRKATITALDDAGAVAFTDRRPPPSQRQPRPVVGSMGTDVPYPSAPGPRPRAGNGLDLAHVRATFACVAFSSASAETGPSGRDVPFIGRRGRSGKPLQEVLYISV
jgi:hypothetical protein